MACLYVFLLSVATPSFQSLTSSGVQPGVAEEAGSRQHRLLSSKMEIRGFARSGSPATDQSTPPKHQHSSSPPGHVLEKRVEPGWEQSEINQLGQPVGELSALHRSASLPTRLGGDVRDPALLAMGAKRDYKQRLGLQRGGAVSPPAGLRGLQVHDADLGGILRSRPQHPRMHLANLRTERERLQHEMTAPHDSAASGNSVQQMCHILRYRGHDLFPAEHGQADAHHRMVHLCDTAYHVPPHYQMAHDREFARQAELAGKWHEVMRMQSRLGETMLRPALRQRRARQLDEEIRELEQRRQREAAARRWEQEQRRAPTPQEGPSGQASPGRQRFNPVARVMGEPNGRSGRPPPAPQAQYDVRQGLAPARGPRNRVLSRPSSSASLESIPEDSGEHSSPESR